MEMPPELSLREAVLGRTKFQVCAIVTANDADEQHSLRDISH
jgi:hypothetical protein